MGFNQITADMLEPYPKQVTRAVAEAAWASTKTDPASHTGDVEAVVLKMLSANPIHNSPFEEPDYRFWLKMPIFLERQFDKHRISIQEQDFNLEFYTAGIERVGISQNELSGRYRTLPNEFYSLPEDLQAMGFAADELDGIAQATFDMYNETLDVMRREGWHKPDHKRNWQYKRAREVIRGYLPVNTMTYMRIKLNLSSLMNVLRLRLEESAQVEAQVLGARMVEQMHLTETLPRALYTETSLGENYERVRETYLPSLHKIRI